MQATAEILGKKFTVEWSAAADKAMGELAAPLLVEMELYFSCLIRKVVRFSHASAVRYSVALNPKLTISYRPVVTRTCKVSDIGSDEEPPVDDFEMIKPEAFVPKHLFIDFKRGEWVGEFQMQ